MHSAGKSCGLEWHSIKHILNLCSLPSSANAEGWLWVPFRISTILLGLGATIHTFGYKANRLWGLSVVFIFNQFCMAFSITVNSLEPQPIQLNFLQHWVTMLSLSLLRSHRPEPLGTALLPSPQQPGKAPQNRVSTGFREEISEESWHLHCGYAYLLLCHRQRFPQIKCTKLHDWGNTWPKTAKWTQPGHGKRLQRWETKK